jgi:uncharacterized protein YjiS (DUF1127 family)
MSHSAIRPAAPAIYERLYALLQHILAGKSGTNRPNMALTDLSDALLKDIGVEFQEASGRADDFSTVPYRSYGGLAAAAVLAAGRPQE